MGFNILDPHDWKDLGDTIAGGFDSAVDWLAGAGDVMVGTLADGAVKVYKSSTGALSYAADLSKTSASRIKSWSTDAAGDVGEFTVGAYQQAAAWARDAWRQLQRLGMMSPPELGPEDPRARQAMVALLGLGTNDSLVRAWEDDAKRKGYTLAFDLRGKFAVPSVMAGAFGGVYVDKLGKWGFIGAVGVSTNASPAISLQAVIDVYMIFGDREAYAQKYLMPGLTVAVPLPTGAAIAAGGNVLLTSSYKFKGFRLTCGLEAITPNSAMILPDVGPPQNNVLGAALSVKSTAYDAACRAAQNPAQEPAILSTATAAALPFLRDPSQAYELVAQHSKKCIEVVAAALVDKAMVAQGTYRGLTCQKFRFESTGEDDGAFYIRAVHTIEAGVDKVLDITGRSMSKEAPVQQYQQKSSNNDNQRFRFLYNNDGSFCIIAKHSGLVFDVYGISTTDGARLQQYRWHSKGNQRFKAVPA